MKLFITIAALALCGCDQPIPKSRFKSVESGHLGQTSQYWEIWQDTKTGKKYILIDGTFAEFDDNAPRELETRK